MQDWAAIDSEVFAFQTSARTGLALEKCSSWVSMSFSSDTWVWSEINERSVSDANAVERGDGT